MSTLKLCAVNLAKKPHRHNKKRVIISRKKEDVCGDTPKHRQGEKGYYFSIAFRFFEGKNYRKKRP